MPSPSITHVFFDIGGVLGTNGWDREQRVRAAERFGLESEFEQRHDELVAEWEIGRATLAEYLESVVFFCPRSFTHEEFIAFMLAESKPFPASIALVRRLADAGRVRLMTLNNESEELNRHRIVSFGLRELFGAFLSSCWLGVRKPSRAIFSRALGIADAEPSRVLFVDDREQNLVPAHALGFQTHHFTASAELERTLRELGLIQVASSE
jgi:putative hydrolase of the HAD superfamily